MEEAEVGLGLEEQGQVSRLTRSTHEGEEFKDLEGNAWDVKGFRSGAGRGGFTLGKSMDAIRTEMNVARENIMIDTRKLSATDLASLRQAVQEAFNAGELPSSMRVLWWP